MSQIKRRGKAWQREEHWHVGRIGENAYWERRGLSDTAAHQRAHAPPIPLLCIFLSLISCLHAKLLKAFPTSHPSSISILGTGRDIIGTSTFPYYQLSAKAC